MNTVVCEMNFTQVVELKFYLKFNLNQPEHKAELAHFTSNPTPTLNSILIMFLSDNARICF